MHCNNTRHPASTSQRRARRFLMRFLQFAAVFITHLCHEYLIACGAALSKGHELATADTWSFTAFFALSQTARTAATEKPAKHLKFSYINKRLSYFRRHVRA